eukprot:7880572-Heterocapsa_arctica.AAC.1
MPTSRKRRRNISSSTKRPMFIGRCVMRGNSESASAQNPIFRISGEADGGATISGSSSRSAASAAAS